MVDGVGGKVDHGTLDRFRIDDGASVRKRPVLLDGERDARRARQGRSGLRD